MDETIYVILKLLFDFALEVWFSVYTGAIITNESTRTEPPPSNGQREAQINFTGQALLIRNTH